MLYDKTMKKTGRIELKLKNGKTILISVVGLKEGDALMLGLMIIFYHLINFYH